LISDVLAGDDHFCQPTMAKSPTWKWQLMWIRHATEEDEAGRLGNMFK
jgi:hypothetical protein